MAGKRRKRVISHAAKVVRVAPPKNAMAGVNKDVGATRAWMGLARVSSTVAKNDFANLVHRVERGSKLVVMRHERPAVVMIPVAEFESLANVQAERLDALTARFDAELAAMNAPEIWRGTKRGFMASLDERPSAAVVATPKKGRARTGS